MKMDVDAVCELICHRRQPLILWLVRLESKRARVANHNPRHDDYLRFAWLRRSRPLRPVRRTLPIDDPPARPSTFVDLTRETCRERGFTWPGVDMDISLAVRKLGVTKRRMRYVYLKAAAAALRQPGSTNALTLCRAGNMQKRYLTRMGRPIAPSFGALADPVLSNASCWMKWAWIVPPLSESIQTAAKAVISTWLLPLGLFQRAPLEAKRFISSAEVACARRD